MKPATLYNWKCCADKWLLPHIGHLPCEDVKNKSVKALVETLVKAGLSAQSITNYVRLVKLALAAAVDEEGNPSFPRTWNSTFIDMPVISNQHRPTFTAEAMSSIAKKTEGQIQLLVVLLASTGLRIGEAFALEVKHVSSDCRTLSVEQSMWNRSIQSPKTANAHRRVDLCTPVAVLLGEHLGTRTKGYVFQTRCGTPLHTTNILRGDVHPLLKDLGLGKCGFHAFRRFRATHLRKSRTPESLIRFWLGHAAESITDSYDKSWLDDAYRHAEADRVQTGFSTDW